MVLDATIIWVLGGLGSGKTTHCEQLVEKYGFVHLNTINLAVKEIESGSHRGRALAEKVDKSIGLDSDYMCLMKRAILQVQPSAEGFLIDGFPRDVEEAGTFERIITKPDLILNLDCPVNTLISRQIMRDGAGTPIGITAKRHELVLRRRIALHRAGLDSILEKYKSNIVQFDANRPFNEVFSDVCCAVDCMLAKRNPPEECCIRDCVLTHPRAKDEEECN